MSDYHEVVDSPQVLLTNVCMSKEIFKSNSPEKRIKMFNEYLPNKLEYKIIDINQSQECMACTGTMMQSHGKCVSSKGYNAYYKRIRYLGNKKKCCLKSNYEDNKINYDIHGNHTKALLTCDPKFLKYSSLNCREVKDTYCSVNNNIFTKDICKQHCEHAWVNCINIKKEICNDPIRFANNRKYCDNFCLQYEGHCDDSILNFCEKKENQNEKICSCVNSIYKNKEFQGINPKCVDKECMVHGYSTMALKNTTNKTSCPTINCQLIVNSKMDLNMKNNILRNSCGMKESAIMEENKKDEKRKKIEEKNKKFKNLIAYLGIMFLLISIYVYIK